MMYILPIDFVKYNEDGCTPGSAPAIGDIEIKYTTDDSNYKTMATLGEAEKLAELEWNHDST